MKRLFLLLTLAGSLAAPTAALASHIVDVDAVNNYLANPVQIFLTAGTYDVTPVMGTYTAWSAWDGVSPNQTTTCAVPSGCAQDPDRGWLNSYIVVSPDIAPVFGHTLFLPGDGYAVINGLVYPSANDAFANAIPSRFVLSQDGLVGFANGESLTSAANNRGGMSLDVQGVVPEPSAALLFAVGAVLGGRSVRRRPA